MKWLPQSYYDTIKKFWQSVVGVEKETVRARTEEGKFVADDKSTPDINEAYTTVKKKKKKGRPKKKK